MNKKTFTIRYVFPSRSQKYFLELSFPHVASKWISVQISLKRITVVFDCFPWFGSFVSWKTYPKIWTLLFGSFSQPSSNRIFSRIALLLNRPAKGWPHKFLSRGTTGSYMFDHDVGHLCLGRRIHTSGHSDFGILMNFGASSKIHQNECCYGFSCLSITVW